MAFKMKRKGFPMKSPLEHSQEPIGSINDKMVQRRHNSFHARGGEHEEGESTIDQEHSFSEAGEQARAIKAAKRNCAMMGGEWDDDMGCINIPEEGSDEDTFNPMGDNWKG